MPPKRSAAVREPIQIYLTADERGLLDGLAERTGLSRAEVLRRGLRRFAAQEAGGASPFLGFLESLASATWPADLAERHDAHLAAAWRDRHER